jgi:hypothetical protein
MYVLQDGVPASGIGVCDRPANWRVSVREKVCETANARLGRPCPFDAARNALEVELSIVGLGHLSLALRKGSTGDKRQETHRQLKRPITQIGKWWIE